MNPEEDGQDPVRPNVKHPSESELKGLTSLGPHAFGRKTTEPDEKCPICHTLLDIGVDQGDRTVVYLVGDQPMLAACTHLFHECCILQWCTSKGLDRSSCPMCRSVVRAAMPTTSRANRIICIDPAFADMMQALFPRQPTCTISQPPPSELLED